jgi:hypothetical protein
MGLGGNEQRRIGMVNSRPSPGVPIKVPFCKNTARRGEMLFTKLSGFYRFIKRGAIAAAFGRPSRRGYQARTAGAQAPLQ